MSKNPALKRWRLERQIGFAVANTDQHIKSNPELDLKTALSASLSRAMHRSLFLEKAASPPWRTDRYNELDGFTGYGTDKSKKLDFRLTRRKKNCPIDYDFFIMGHIGTEPSEEVKERTFWNTPIDMQIKDPWPAAKWDWFEDNIGGARVWGTGGGTMELGQKRGKNGVLLESYYMDEWVIPGSTGGKMKFWAHKQNLAKHLMRLLADYTGAAEQGDTLREEYEKQFPDVSTDSIPNLIPGDSLNLSDRIALKRKLEISSEEEQVRLHKDYNNGNGVISKPMTLMQAKKDSAYLMGLQYTDYIEAHWERDLKTVRIKMDNKE